MCLQKFNLNIRALCSFPESLLILDQYSFHVRISPNEERRPGILPVKLHHLSSSNQENTSLLPQLLPQHAFHILLHTVIHT